MEEEVRKSADKFRDRKKHDSNEKRHDRIQNDEAEAMLYLKEKYQLTSDQIASWFDRDYRAVDKALKRAELIVKRDEIEKAPVEEAVTESHRLRQRHLERIYDQVEKIRECLTDIHAEEQGLKLGMLNRAGPLMINEYDWRLDPIRWRELVTPDFTMPEAWDYELRMAVSHMRKSPFFKNLGRLRHLAKKLALRYDELAKILEEEGTLQPGTWKGLHFKSRFLTEISRTPINPKPSQSDYRPYYKEQFCADVINEFSRLDDDIPKALSYLNELLKQLYIDLRPENIEPIIESGSCYVCPKS